MHRSNNVTHLFTSLKTQQHSVYVNHSPRQMFWNKCVCVCVCSAGWPPCVSTLSLRDTSSWCLWCSSSASACPRSSVCQVSLVSQHAPVLLTLKGCDSDPQRSKLKQLRVKNACFYSCIFTKCICSHSEKFHFYLFNIITLLHIYILLQVS